MPTIYKFSDGRRRTGGQPWTDCEGILFNALLHEHYRFGCNVAVSGKIVDFRFYGTPLLIELHGSIHKNPDKQKLDEAKRIYLESKGYTILYLTNKQVLTDLDECLNTIREAYLPFVPHVKLSRRDCV
ncbi:MAG: endonuclease domain-containing protein [Pelatocladus maniniholoensis HA4357-MV3]|jgi:very-short-patch-repair endonuclease|uniref:Endonuclease domain-containing protein n=1 Tax=Pelatocladus maniniholoensis HA4357-MV3 TaxID=1117104 RepID=A0A9E3HC42_9NOST|nr:endonuclease domain-containing protein [Pelatocladus maniniholoensis HA4357-MV3]